MMDIRLRNVMRDHSKKGFLILIIITLIIIFAIIMIMIIFQMWKQYRELL